MQRGFTLYKLWTAIENILAEGAQKARAIAAATMDRLRRATGIR